MANHDLIKIEQHLKASEFELAEKHALRMRTDEATRQSVLASIALKAGDRQRSEVLFQRALALNPDHALALANYTKLLVSQRKFKAALSFAEKAYKASPLEESIALTYVQCLAESDRFQDATKVLAAYLERPNPSVAVILAQSSVLRADLRPQESLYLLERHIPHHEGNAELERALADVYAELDPVVALEHFKKLEGKKENIQATWNRSFVELRLRRFNEGWLHYEAGLDEKIGKIGRPLPAQVRGLPVVTTLEQLDPSKWTIFVAEQGLGDQVLFLGALREAFQDVPHAAYIGEERLTPILARSFPGLPIYPYAMGLNLAKHRHRINGLFPIGSLQKIYRNSEEKFRQNEFPYLKPNPDLVNRYRDKLKAKAGDKPLIGLSWRGGFWDRQKRTKSFDLELFAPMMKALGAEFISLQYGDVKEEREYRRANGLPLTFVEGIDFKKEIDAWFAIACACDHIVSVSTALVHFCGAAGRSVDLLLGDGQSPFIWGTESGPSIAYPSVSVHRKSKEESAEEYFNRVTESVKCRFTQS